jgi:Zn-dependent peptidase ImmA (M78 family)
MIVDLLTASDEIEEHTYVGSSKIENGAESIAGSISKQLDFDHANRSARKGVDSLFRELRAKSEKIGIFVLLVGDLGSHHSSLSTDVFRGFAIADKIAPLIVINDQDALAAWSFTLIHELAHIWLGQSGVSGDPEPYSFRSRAARVERFCDDVASQFLLPSQSLPSKPTFEAGDAIAAAAEIKKLADQWSVSEPMVAYRFGRLGWISRDTYRKLATDYSARWRAAKQREKEKAKENDGGPSYYAVRRHRLGDALIDLVRQNLRDHALTYTKAAKMLGVKPNSVEPLLRANKNEQGVIGAEG